MCTLTWRRDPDSGLEVFFNRDELKSRPIADPPARFDLEDSSFLSPRDPKGAGTWMLANENGVVICLLNRWELEGRSVEEPRSRGRLVWSLAGVRSVDEVTERMVDLESYQAFTLVVFSPFGDRCFEWDGRELGEGAVPAFLTSSSYRFEEVKMEREGYFLSGGRGEGLHASTGRESSAFTILMNRPDAQTWSRSRVKVKGEVCWNYLAEQPDLKGEPEETVISMALR